MATLTIRNVSPKLVKSLKEIAQRNRRSMEQEVRLLLEEYAGERLSVLEQIEAGWSQQTRCPTADEVEGWLGAGRE